MQQPARRVGPGGLLCCVCAAWTQGKPLACVELTLLPCCPIITAKGLLYGDGELGLLTVSARTLHILAALVWYAGALMLLLKGSSLLAEAETLDPGRSWPWLASILALLLGGLKARFIFGKSIRRNLARIAVLDGPRFWQFFSPGFFAALAVMIGAGASLSRLAHGSYPFLIAVAVLDLAIALALLGSSVVYWQQKAFARQGGAL